MMPDDFVIEPLALLRCSVFYSCSRSQSVRASKFVQRNKRIKRVKLREEGESQSQLGRGASRRFEQEEDGDDKRRRRRRRRQTRLTTYTRTIPTSKTIVQLHYNCTRTLNIDLVLGGL